MKKIDSRRLKTSFKKSLKGLGNSLPVIFAIVLLIGLVNNLLTGEMIVGIFSGNGIFDSLVGSALGSVLAGNPVTSYILSGELLKNGVGLFAVTSFMVAWVTVGIIQLPAESVLLGKKFAIIRNATAFVFSIVVAAITVFLVGVL